MSKKEVRAEAAEPVSETASSNPGDQNDLTAYTEQTSLGGPIFKIGTYGPMPCRLQLSSKILERSGLKPRDQVQLIAEEGQIIIRKTGGPSPGLHIQGCSAAKKQMLDTLMAETRAFEAEQRAARERRMAYREEIAAGAEGVDGAAPLNLEQVSEEEL
jgi:bifunctional DNA-binding transcriptional regulator/antitoxin component of YhaV-PrlF toxin-antitoxin module